MNADGSGAHQVAAASGTPDDVNWGDIAWSADDWIFFIVSQNVNGCFNLRTDKIRPDGTSRTQVSDGGPNCLYSFASEPWFSSKPESDLSFASEPSCIEGIPKGRLMETESSYSVNASTCLPRRASLRH
jgi:hypothetical protein